MTEGLYAELMGTSVRVSVVFPDAVDTKIAESSWVKNLSTDSSLGKLARRPEKAAANILRGVERDPFQVYVGSDAKGDRPQSSLFAMGGLGLLDSIGVGQTRS